MGPLRTAWRDYLGAASSVSRPARLFLLATLLSWTGYGVNQVLFNLYQVEGGFQEAFVGRIIALNGVGLAIAALPAGWLAERRGRIPCLILGATIYGLSHLTRALVLVPAVIGTASFFAGVGQALTAIAAAPFLSEHSSARERTHLFSIFFATELLAGVIGSLLGGWMPSALHAVPLAGSLHLLYRYRWTLVAGALLDFLAMIPLLRLRGVAEAPFERGGAAADPRERRKILPVVVNAFLIGAGAGLVIPFMNLYFKTRFACSSAQIGGFFAVAQVSTAFAMLVGPVIARRAGKLRTAIGLQLLSLPFLVTLGAEHRLKIAVGSFWLRAMLMQASTPLVNTFVMEALPPALRARATSFINLVWNIGWATSATFAGALIQGFGYAVPFYVTATLYLSASTWFYLSFRGTREMHDEDTRLSEEAKGLRGEGPMTE
jgi:MFS family permease